MKKIKLFVVDNFYGLISFGLCLSAIIMICDALMGFVILRKTNFILFIILFLLAASSIRLIFEAFQITKLRREIMKMKDSIWTCDICHIKETYMEMIPINDPALLICKKCMSIAMWDLKKKLK